MIKNWMAVALLASATLAHAQTPAASAPSIPSVPSSPAKKELVAKVLQLQQPAIEAMARSVVQRPAMQLWQASLGEIQNRVPQDKREAVAKSVEADLKKFIDDSTPVVRDRAVKLAPTVVGPVLEEKFSEDELKTLVTWLESPVNKKYQQAAPQFEQAFVQKLLAESAPLIDPKLQALQNKIRTTLGVPEGKNGQAPAAGPAAKPPAKAASR